MFSLPLMTTNIFHMFCNDSVLYLAGRTPAHRGDTQQNARVRGQILKFNPLFSLFKPVANLFLLLRRALCRLCRLSVRPDLRHNLLCSSSPVAANNASHSPTPSIIRNNFHPQFHSPLEIFWLRWNSFKTRDILVDKNEKS